MEQKQQIPTYKLIPFVVFASVLLISGLFLGNRWQAARKANLETDVIGVEDSAEPNESYTVTIVDLPQLPDGFSYTVWGVKEDIKQELAPLSFEDNSNSLSIKASEYTNLELHIYSTVASKGIVFLRGTVEAETITLEPEIELDAATGSFILATPTTPSLFDETSGAHFVNEDGNSASIILPELSEDWTYSASVSDGDKIYPMGSFTNLSADDDFNTTSGTGNTFGFPGEDFICIEKLNNLLPENCSSLDLSLGNYSIHVGLTSVFAKDAILIPLLETSIPAGSKSGVEIELEQLSQNTRVTLSRVLEE